MLQLWHLPTPVPTTPNSQQERTGVQLVDVKRYDALAAHWTLGHRAAVRRCHAMPPCSTRRAPVLCNDTTLRHVGILLAVHCEYSLGRIAVALDSERDAVHVFGVVHRCDHPARIPVSPQVPRGILAPPRLSTAAVPRRRNTDRIAAVEESSCGADRSRPCDSTRRLPQQTARLPSELTCRASTHST